MRKKIYLLVLLIMGLVIAGGAQPAHINFTALTSKDGLLSNTVNAILKDRYGLMWFATDDGLNKFDGTNFTVYRHVPGDSGSLRANEVLALFEDGQGQLWVGTSGGAVSLYDRKKDRFVHFPGGGDRSGLVSNAVVRGICSDGGGKIWIAQYASPYLLDPSTGVITKLELGYPPRAGTSPVSLECVFADRRGRVWVGTDGGLFLYQPARRTFVRFRHDPDDGQSLVNDHVRVLAEDASGRLWVGTDGGLCMMKPDEGIFVNCRVAGRGDAVLGYKSINSIVPDSDGKLWIGTMEGLEVLDAATWRTVKYLPNGNVHGLTSKAIKSIYIDKEGIYWLGTYRGGINKYDKNLNLFDVKLSEAFPEGGSGRPVVSCFAERRDGKVWVGTDGEGLYCFDRVADRLERVPLRGVGTEAPAVLALTATREGRLYIGTLGDGLLETDADGRKARRIRLGPAAGNLNGDEVYCILEDRQGLIWVGTNGQGVTVLSNDRVVARYTPAPIAPTDVLLPVNGYIRALEEDGEGNIWIGTHGGGLAVLHRGDRRATFYNQDNSRLPIDKIHALLCDSKGRMWVGTYGGGLSVFDKASGQFTSYTEKDGLANTTIYQMLEDADARLWVSTNTGISSFDPETKTFRNFTGLNGVQNSNFVHGSGLRLTDGELLFGGLQGFNYFYPSRLTVNRNVPAVVLTDLQIANKSVSPGKGSPIQDQVSVAGEIRLEYKQNFALSFVALNYTLPKQNHYAYTLDGFDKEWNYTGAMNTARYTNLDPGKYVFRVKASNNDGVWSKEERTIRIYVRPPFWRTFYAYLFYVLAAGGILLYSRYRGVTRMRRKFRLEQERAEVQRMQELDRMKLKFLTNLSHEFRTPISLIMGPAEELLTDERDKGSKDKLFMIRRNARRLLNLVNQLLDFRKMEEQELRLLPAEGEWVAFVKDVVYSFKDLSGRKQIQLDFISPLPRLYGLFDGDKLERILFNLLSNAFKFTLEGGRISVGLDVRADSGMQWVSIVVRDTGVGIPGDQLPLIFDRFFQHTAENGVLNQGTGIGLSITRELVRLHGGTISVESEVGRGSVFTVLLPLREVGPAVDTGVEEPEQAEVAEVAEGTEARPRVLLVEDNEDFRSYLRDNLRTYYHIIEATDGKEGWQKALAGHPQLIVSDISMPNMDGIEFSKKLKADKRTCHIPIILLTALTGEAQQVAGLETGANDYITKPFNFEVLHTKIRNLLELRRNLKTTYTRQIQVLQPEVEMQSEDERLLQAIVRCLEEHIASPQLSVEFLSREVGMSRSKLYGKMLELTGETPVEYIRGFKLDKAAILLEKSDVTIAEAAYQTGFSKPNYFARAFKAKFDMLPSEYVARRRKRGENRSL